MDSFAMAVGSAFWLGIMTSISPCPLATNITALSFIGRKMDCPSYVWLSGLLYTAGRTMSYAVLAAVLVGGVLSISSVSFALQRYLNKALGPLLIVTGLVVVGLIPLSISGDSRFLQKIQVRAEGWGLWGSAALGLLFALSFCPVSAALFFGSLIPLSFAHESRLILPVAYGIGTAAPVAVFAVLIALGARSLGTVFHQVGKIEKWGRLGTGIIFIGVGIYLSLTYWVR